MTDAYDLTHQVAIAAAKVSPPVVVTLYALVTKGLPVVIGFLTLVYLSLQIAVLLWRWKSDFDRRREIERALNGKVPGYEPRIPK